MHPKRGKVAVGVKLVLWDECGRADRIDFHFERDDNDDDDDTNQNEVPNVHF